MASFLVIAIALAVAFLFFSRSQKVKSGNWVQFVTVGQEAGFSLKELETLHRVAMQNNIEDPSSIFMLQGQLDICIGYMVRAIKMAAGDSDQGTQDFLSKLYDYRKKIEMNKPHSKSGIATSRQINEGQHLRIMVTGMGTYTSQLLHNSGHEMIISRPVNTNVEVPISWKNTKVSVNFWRENDAGYTFESDVLDEVFSRGLPSLKIAHSDSLLRTQKRNSVRLRMHQKAAFLYLASAGETPHTIERNPGLKCSLDDLSDSGCAVIVGGKVEPGLRVKIQFSLNSRAICMTGTVRSVSFQQEANQSILHIESEALPVGIRNLILGEVFGMAQNDIEADDAFDAPSGASAAGASPSGEMAMDELAMDDMADIAEGDTGADDTVSWPPLN